MRTAIVYSLPLRFHRRFCKQSRWLKNKFWILLIFIVYLCCCNWFKFCLLLNACCGHEVYSLVTSGSRKKLLKKPLIDWIFTRIQPHSSAKIHKLTICLHNQLKLYVTNQQHWWKTFYISLKIVKSINFEFGNRNL